MFELKTDGVTRTVVLTKRWAFKFPAVHRLRWSCFLMGLLGNMQERSFTRLSDVRLMPVVFSLWGGFMVVMPRAEELTEEQFGDFEYREWAGAPVPLVSLVEDKRSSFGWFEGRVVAVDYGG